MTLLPVFQQFPKNGTRQKIEKQIPLISANILPENIGGYARPAAIFGTHPFPHELSKESDVQNVIKLKSIINNFHN